MRAGPYAVVGGRTYKCTPPHVERVSLLVSGTEPQPAGFERDNRGRWRRRVDRSDITRMFVVETTARWKNREVKVLDALNDEAFIEYDGPDSDGALRDELTHDKYEHWTGSVPISALSDIVEREREVPL